jgi:hypothetical protein
MLPFLYFCAESSNDKRRESRKSGQISGREISNVRISDPFSDVYMFNILRRIMTEIFRNLGPKKEIESKIFGVFEPLSIRYSDISDRVRGYRSYLSR